MYTAPFHTVCYTLCLKSLFFMGSDCGDYTPCDIICTLSICGKTLFSVNSGELSSLKCGETKSWSKSAQTHLHLSLFSIDV